jgi:hypothetical protein
VTACDFAALIVCYAGLKGRDWPEADARGEMANDDRSNEHLIIKCPHAACCRDHYDHSRRSVRSYGRLVRNLAIDGSAKAR